MSEALKNRLKSLIDNSGRSAREVSLAAGMNEYAVRDILNGKSKRPEFATLQAVADALKVPLSAITGEHVPAETEGSAEQHHPGTLPMGLGTAMGTIPTRSSMPQNLPVFGTAQGAQGDEGAFVINMGGQIGFVHRPPGLIGNRDAFAIYVEGDSMEPRYEHGEMVVVDPNRPVRPGDDVVLLIERAEPGREPQAYIKRLVRRGAQRVVVTQFNPRREMEFSTDAVKKVFRVLRMEALLG